MSRIFTLLLPLLLGASIGLYFFSYYKPTQPLPLEVSVDSIGTSVKGRAIESHTFGSGDMHLVIVGGMHGGYEWNTSKLAHELISHFTKNPDAVPRSHKLTIIPVANPDGLHAVTGTTTNLATATLPTNATKRAHGRFNANSVDLNRNFDCKWQEKSMWGQQEVSAGANAFSEPETQALRSFVESKDPDAFIFLHSKADAVYASECHDGVLPETKTLLEIYANASGYSPVEQFDAYPITGDAEGWLASMEIPAITVELSDHESTEFEKNLRGITAVLEHEAFAIQKENLLQKTEAAPFYSY